MKDCVCGFYLPPFWFDTGIKTVLKESHQGRSYLVKKVVVSPRKSHWHAMVKKENAEDSRIHRIFRTKKEALFQVEIWKRNISGMTYQ